MFNFLFRQIIHASIVDKIWIVWYAEKYWNAKEQTEPNRTERENKFYFVIFVRSCNMDLYHDYELPMRMNCAHLSQF